MLVVALDPELVDFVGQLQGQVGVRKLDGSDVLEPALERVVADFRAKRGTDFLPEGSSRKRFGFGVRESGFHVEIQRAEGCGIFRMTGLVHRSVGGSGSRL